MAGSLAEIHNRIVRTDVKLPNNQQKLAFVLENVYTKEECGEFISKTEKRGYEGALVNVGFGKQEAIPDVRNSDRCIWDSKELAEKMFDRIKPHIPEVFKSRTVLGINERLRFLRYDPVQYFKPHKDGSYMRDNGELSLITVHLYLNEGFKGGSTTFVDMQNWTKDRMEGPKETDVECVPKMGSVLVFQHDILHEGSPLFEGRKYTMRSDIMYSAKITQSS